MLGDGALWTISCWINLAEAVPEKVLVTGVRDLPSEYARYLSLGPGGVSPWMGHGNDISEATKLDYDHCHLLAATFDGTAAPLYADGSEVASGRLAYGSTAPQHPGIPNKQSLLGDAGTNGGAMMIDGPAFRATEGWDGSARFATEIPGFGRR